MWENIDIKLVPKEITRNCLVSDPNNHTTNIFTERLQSNLLKVPPLLHDHSPKTTKAKSAQANSHTTITV